MKQFIVPQSLAQLKPDDTLLLDGEDFHYLIRVRRLELGAEVQIRDAAGVAARARLHSVFRGGLSLRVLEFIPEEQPPEQAAGTRAQSADSTAIPDLHLILGIPKGKKTDLILRQAAELAVSGITLVPSRNSQVKMTKEEFSRKAERWEKILKEAVQQSNSPRLPALSYGPSMQQACTRALEDETRMNQGIFLHQIFLGEASLHKLLSDAAARDADTTQPRAVHLAVGPEGGFSPDECEEMQKMAFHPVFLGDTILRTETAALYALAAVRTILLEGYSWQPNDLSPADQDL